jgi:hypothetical protein
MTKGEYRVGIAFNPSNDDMVGQIKRKAADLIDLIETIPATTRDENIAGLGLARAADTRASEVSRLKSLAQTEIEAAAMWAVKAATKPPVE